MIVHRDLAMKRSPSLRTAAGCTPRTRSQEPVIAKLTNDRPGAAEAVRLEALGLRAHRHAERRANLDDAAEVIAHRLGAASNAHRLRCLGEAKLSLLRGAHCHTALAARVAALAA